MSHETGTTSSGSTFEDTPDVILSIDPAKPGTPIFIEVLGGNLVRFVR